LRRIIDSGAVLPVHEAVSNTSQLVSEEDYVTGLSVGVIAICVLAIVAFEQDMVRASEVTGVETNLYPDSVRCAAGNAPMSI
jgi:hypothetical protein